jgi:hypothetical protein
MNLDDVIGLGVAGNFTGHLEQAGEAAGFEGVTVRDAWARSNPSRTGSRARGSRGGRSSASAQSATPTTGKATS